jgi:hypothetical protein
MRRRPSPIATASPAPTPTPTRVTTAPVVPRPRAERLPAVWRQRRNGVPRPGQMPKLTLRPCRPASLCGTEAPALRQPPMANAAWLAFAVMAHNLGRPVGQLAGADLKRATAATLRRKVFTVPGQLVHSGLQHRLQLPEHWPWAEAITQALSSMHAIPCAANPPGRPAAAHGRRRAPDGRALTPPSRSSRCSRHIARLPQDRSTTARQAPAQGAPRTALPPAPCPTGGPPARAPPAPPFRRAGRARWSPGRRGPS